MPEHAEPTLQDHLDVILTKGDQVMFDSREENKKKGPKKPNLIIDPVPPKFCLEDGSPLKPLVYLCETCGKRYQKMLDEKTKQSVMMISPVEPPEDDEKIEMRARIQLLEKQLGVPEQKNETPST